MQSVNEEEGLTRQQQTDPIVSTDTTDSTQKEKKVIIRFRAGKDRHPSGMRRLSVVEETMPGSQEPAAEPVQLANDPVLIPFCDHVQPVSPSEIGTSFRIFSDRIGMCWKCLTPLTCPHAIVMEGAIYSCRVRSSEINEIQSGLMDPVLPVRERSA